MHCMPHNVISNLQSQTITMKAENESVEMLTTSGMADLAEWFAGAYAASTSCEIELEAFQYRKRASVVQTRTLHIADTKSEFTGSEGDAAV